MATEETPETREVSLRLVHKHTGHENFAAPLGDVPYVLARIPYAGEDEMVMEVYSGGEGLTTESETEVMQLVHQALGTILTVPPDEPVEEV